MRISVAVIALAAMSTGLSAQAFDAARQTQIWDANTEFTSRGANGGQANSYVSQGFQYGFIANLRTLSRSQYVMQDQDLATQECYNVGTTGLDTRALPDYANTRFYSTNICLPIGSGIGAYIVTHTGLAGTPHSITANPRAQWHHVWNMPVASNWTTDGLSVHMSQGASYTCSGGTAPTRLCCPTANRHREIPRFDAYSGTPTSQINEELGFSESNPPGTPRGVDRTWRHLLWFGEEVLKGFSVNTVWNGSACGSQFANGNPGYASIDPNINDLNQQSPARIDDPKWQIRAGAPFANGIGLFFMTSEVIPNGGLPTPFGTLHVDILQPIQGSPPCVDVLALFSPADWGNVGALDATGARSWTLPLGPGSAIRNALSRLGAGMIHVQGAAVNTSGKVQLTSLWSMRTELLPMGYSHGTATASTPLDVNKKNAGPINIVVRNDGRGELHVQGLNSAGNPFGVKTIVAERSAACCVISAGNVKVRFSAPGNANTTVGEATDFIYPTNL